MIRPIKTITRTARLIQGPLPSSTRGELNSADWLSAVRVNIYTVAAVAADNFIGWLTGMDKSSMSWWVVIVIGLILGVAELLRRLDKDYAGQPPRADAPQPMSIEEWREK